MYAANADRIPSTDADDSDALRRLVWRRSPRLLGAALLGGAIEARPAVGGRRAAAVGPRALWRAIVVTLCLGLVPVGLAAPAWAAKGDLDLVSRAAGATGTFGNGSSEESAISADGRYVAFTSWASNLHPDDGDINTDVFVRDLEEGTVTLVSRATGADGDKAAGDNSGFFSNVSTSPAISADGRYVAFQSRASNLHPDDGDRTLDVFVRDLEANTTTLVSRAGGADGAKANGPSWAGSHKAAISADGRYVAFDSWASNLHPDDGDTTPDVFVRDLEANTTTLVSRAGGADGDKGDDYAVSPAISADGRFVAFESDATNLHPDDGDSNYDVFVRDLEANTTTLVNRATGAAGDKGDDQGFNPAISADGRFVAFESDATNLHPDDGDSNYDVFVRDLEAHTTTLVSRATGTTGANGNDQSYTPAISADGRFVAFESYATNLHPDDGNGLQDVFRRDVLGPLLAAAADAYATDEDTPLSIDAAAGVLGNDTDPDGDGLTAALVSGPAHGSLTLNTDGSFRYMPDPDYNGADSFSYRATDGTLNSDPVTVAIEVRPVDDPAPLAGPTSPPATVPASASAPAPAVAAQPALGRLRLASRCVRPSRSGRVRIRMSLRMAQPGPLRIRIDRAVGGGAWSRCPSPDPGRRFTGRFERVASLSEPAARPGAAAAMVSRRLTLRLRLAPGLYRITVRAKLDHDRLSRPVRRYLRVLG
jgi:Tol biopolymer transport system component